MITMIHQFFNRNPLFHSCTLLYLRKHPQYEYDMMIFIIVSPFNLPVASFVDRFKIIEIKNKKNKNVMGMELIEIENPWSCRGSRKSSLWGPKRISNVWAVAVVATWDSSTGFTEFTNKSEQMGLQPAKKGILQHHKPDRILKLTSVDILGLQLMCWTITGTKISTQQMGKILRFQTAISVGSSDCFPCFPSRWPSG